MIINDILADCICMAYVRQAETGAGEQSEQVTVEARNVWKTVCIQRTGGAYKAYRFEVISDQTGAFRAPSTFFLFEQS